MLAGLRPGGENTRLASAGWRHALSRHYTRVSQAAAENAASRIYLGIHYRFDAIQGVSAGERIADIDFDTLLRPLHSHHPFRVATVNFVAQIDAYLNGTYMDFFNPGGGGSEDTAIALSARDFRTLVPLLGAAPVFTPATQPTGAGLSATHTGSIAPNLVIHNDSAATPNAVIGFGHDDSNPDSDLDYLLVIGWKDDEIA